MSRDSFSRSAKQYDRFSYVQQKVAQTLVDSVTHTPRTILDLGCGSGSVIRRLQYAPDLYVGIDRSQSMLDEHPKGKHIQLYCTDFEQLLSCKKISQNAPFDLLIAASSLQWSENLEHTFSTILFLAKEVRFSIFTANTFKTLHDYLGILSPLLPDEDIQKALAKYYEGKIEIRRYSMQYASPKAMLEYIKHSGVGGGKPLLDYKKAKKLLNECPIRELEFEVIFFEGRPKDHLNLL